VEVFGYALSNGKLEGLLFFQKYDKEHMVWIIWVDLNLGCTL